MIIILLLATQRKLTMRPEFTPARSTSSVDLLRPRGNGTVSPKIESLWGIPTAGKACTKYDSKRSRFTAQRARDGAGKINDPVAFRHLVRV